MSFRIDRLVAADAGEVARVHRASFDDRLPWLAGLHTPEEDEAFFRDRVFADCEVRGVREGGALIGFVAFREGWIDQLYVLPHRQGQGVGGSLLRPAKAAWPVLQLWTFQRNAAARRFYEVNGFVAVRETDGSGNEEREPDVLYRWLRR
ncbi:MAG TPA: GNAT family N-acetyltransferase [Geminicoccaceae bacterium]|nr:GNAT family N-acetyltransferase [Geminicoccus sp.]HMU50363.1 GNAT family N-acetyltransferase [Geminicoccaceae bacterium]